MEGGLDAERAERVKCKQEELDRERRNFEAMQASLLLTAGACTLTAGICKRHDAVRHSELVVLERGTSMRCTPSQTLE